MGKTKAIKLEDRKLPQGGIYGICPHCGTNWDGRGTQSSTPSLLIDATAAVAIEMGQELDGAAYMCPKCGFLFYDE